MHAAVKSYANASSRRWKILSVGLAALLIILNSGTKFTGDCLVSFGQYKGHQYTTKETVGSNCLVESKWMRVQQHQVLFSGQSSPISDWLWIDYHDRINVLVEAPSAGSLHGATTSSKTRITDRSQLYFYVFQQSKYALEGQLSMAILGGIIEPGEHPKEAALREVEEEMSLTCDELHPLGRFRTDVNRGMGWVHSFLAMQCHSSVKKNTKTISEMESDGEKVGDTDVERQDLRKISLAELRAAVRNGDFMEVQWSNTVALALMHPELAGPDTR